MNDRPPYSFHAKLLVTDAIVETVLVLSRSRPGLV